jgi:hypothetical protein
MGLKTLFTQPFPQTLKDYYDAAINAFNPNNTAVGVYQTTTVMTGRSGVATFSATVIEAPNVIGYTIYNNNFLPSSIVEVFVYVNEDTTAVISGVYRATGSIIVYLSDGGTGNPAAPIIAYRILA